jgi:hypothetical protein
MKCLLSRIAGCALLALFFGGCGGSSATKTFPATGVVTFKGEPLPNAVVSFIPAGGRPAAGMTNAQGEFSLSTFKAGDGAMPGMHRVALGEPAVEMKEGDYSVPEPKPPRFPVKYTDPNQSGLEFEVKPGAENKFTIELKE